MSDSHQSSVAALATVFGNTMSLVDEGQGEEHSPERWRMITEAEDFLNELNDLSAPPTGVAASAEQLAAAAAAPQQQLPQTVRQRDLYLANNMSNNSNNKRVAKFGGTDSDSTGSDSDSSSDFEDPAHLAECKVI